MALPRDLQVTLRQSERLERLWRRFAREPLPPDLPDILREQLDIDVSGGYGSGRLSNPFIVASGDLTASAERIEKAVEAGWGGIVLKTAAVEDARGRCDLQHLRKEPRPPISRYAPGDAARERPMLRWDGRVYPGGLREYAELARAALAAAEGFGTVVAASLAGPLPGGPDDSCLDAWRHSARELRGAGLSTIEITLEPLRMAETNAGWESLPHILPALAGADVVVRLAGGEAGDVLPGILGAAGLTASRADLSQARAAGPAVSATGGIYTGLHALDCILDGAASVQVYSFLAGKVRRPAKRSFNKFEQALYSLMLDPADGFVAGMLHLKNTAGVSSVMEAAAMRQEPD